MYAGVSGGVLLAAGGANFPKKMPWDGGAKIWYDKIFALEKPGGLWRLAGRLPIPLAYGVSVTHNNTVICAGGSDSRRHYPNTFQLTWRRNRAVAKPLPPMPIAVAYAAGAILGDTLFVMGGQVTPNSESALKSVFSIDLGRQNSRWRRVEAWPGPGRMLAAAAAFRGEIWVIGGVELVSDSETRFRRRYLRDVYRFRPGKGWMRGPDLPHPVAGAPSPAPADPDGIFVLGGDDGANLGFNPPDRHPGFRRTILRFDPISSRWTESGNLPSAPVTAPTAEWKGMTLVVSGEVRPGVRSPEVWGFDPQTTIR